MKGIEPITECALDYMDMAGCREYGTWRRGVTHFWCSDCGEWRPINLVEGGGEKYHICAFCRGENLHEQPD